MAFTGFLLALSSAMFNGSFMVFSKLPSVRSAEVHPLIFQLYTSIGVFLSSLLTIPFILHYYDSIFPTAAGFGFGLLGGALFVFAVAFSLLAVPLAGLSISQSVWSGSAVCVSFAWGVLAFGDEIQQKMAMPALALIVIGVVIIAASEKLTKLIWFGSEQLEYKPITSPPIQPNPVGLAHSLLNPTPAVLNESEPIIHSHVIENVDHSDGIRRFASIAPAFGSADGRFEDQSVRSGNPASASASDSLAASPSSTSLLLVGVIFSVIVGLFGGSILAPMKAAPSASQGLTIVPAFGIGCLLTAPLITLPYVYLIASTRPNFHLRVSFLPGIAAGAVWNAGNICSIFASDLIGYSIAYPIMQCAIVFAAAWGILLFGEIKGRQIGTVVIGIAVVLGGAILLGLSKK